MPTRQQSYKIIPFPFMIAAGHSLILNVFNNVTNPTTNTKIT